MYDRFDISEAKMLCWLSDHLFIVLVIHLKIMLKNNSEMAMVVG